MELYSDAHPETTMKGTGFRDEDKARKTIEIIKYRSPKYQFDVINTMYNRAKYHPNQTPKMRKAMKIFKNWLGKYKKEKIIYPYLPMSTIQKYVPHSEFLDKLKLVNGKYYKLQYIPVGKYDYLSYRNYIIGKIISKKIKYFNKEGSPTRAHLQLISYGYSPFL